jgi:hypothetical protein
VIVYWLYAFLNEGQDLVWSQKRSLSYKNSKRSYAAPLLAGSFNAFYQARPTLIQESAPLHSTWSAEVGSYLVGCKWGILGKNVLFSRIQRNHHSVPSLSSPSPAASVITKL